MTAGIGPPVGKKCGKPGDHLAEATAGIKPQLRINNGTATLEDAGDKQIPLQGGSPAGKLFGGDRHEVQLGTRTLQAVKGFGECGALIGDARHLDTTLGWSRTKEADLLFHFVKRFSQLRRLREGAGPDILEPAAMAGKLFVGDGGQLQFFFDECEIAAEGFRRTFSLPDDGFVIGKSHAGAHDENADQDGEYPAHEHRYTKRLCSTAAAMNDANSGCGSNGFDFNSG